MNATASNLKRGLLGAFKVVISLLIGVLAGVSMALVSDRIWPSLSEPVNKPTPEGFCGTYTPMPGTAEFLIRNYPGVQTRLEFKPDGTALLNAVPDDRQSAGDHATKNEAAKWAIRNRDGRIWLTVSDNEGDSFWPFYIKGQKPPYMIEFWNEKHLYEMRFCAKPQQSAAISAYQALSITDWVIQGLVAATVLALPFLFPRGSASRAFGYPFMIALAWGIWRFEYFDPTTTNDVPGIGYLIIAFIGPILALCIYSIRWAVLLSREPGTGLRAAV